MRNVLSCFSDRVSMATGSVVILVMSSFGDLAAFAAPVPFESARSDHYEDAVTLGLPGQFVPVDGRDTISEPVFLYADDADAPEAKPTIDVIVRPLPPLEMPSAERLAEIERDAIRVVASRPDYPQQLAEQGVEGWVIVEFDITPIGTVQNATVIESQPARVFDESALSAVQSWKYIPKTINGEPVFAYGVRQQISYEIEED